VGTTAVEVEAVSKRFRLFQEKYTSLKERIIHAGKIPYQDLWALNEVSFSVAEGETLGILGRNGSGKSTLLKCICGVLQPTSGRVVVKGALAGLLELGAGFQSELSGRENVYLNGSLLGLSRKDVDRRFDEIVAFAELEQFIDNQVKFYSSGMYVRLGFAVAVNIDPDILVVDEVLAVGDERFQRKCMERVRSFQQEGRTIILVSHSPDQVRGICDRALVMDGGHMLTLGPPGEAIRHFREKLLEVGDVLPLGVHEEAEEVAATNGAPAEIHGEAKAAEEHTRPIRLTEAVAHYPGEEERPYVSAGDPVRIEVGFEAQRAEQGVEFSIELRNETVGVLYKTDTTIMGLNFDVAEGPGKIEFSLPSFPFLDGVYEVVVSVQSHLGGVLYDFKEPACRIEVMNSGRQAGLVAVEMKAAMVGAAEQVAVTEGGGR
jgi:ABC-2 type transport system ATP-binding protein